MVYFMGDIVITVVGIKKILKNDDGHQFSVASPQPSARCVVRTVPRRPGRHFITFVYH